MMLLVKLHLLLLAHLQNKHEPSSFYDSLAAVPKYPIVVLNYTVNQKSTLPVSNACYNCIK